MFSFAAHLSDFQEAIANALAGKMNNTITASYWLISRDVYVTVDAIVENISGGFVVFANRSLTRQILHLVRIVGQVSKMIVHFVRKAPNLAH